MRLALVLLAPGTAAAQAGGGAGALSLHPGGLDLSAATTASRPANVAEHPGAAPPHRDPDVTVIGRRPCGKYDKGCYDRIIEEVWRKYPEQIATMCKDEKVRLVRQGFAEVELGADPFSANTRLTPQTQALCDYGPAHGLAK